MIYTSLSTDLYTTKDKQIAVLVSKKTRLVVARFGQGVCLETVDGFSKFMAKLAYDNHLAASWLEYDYSHILRMTKMVGQVYNWRDF